MVQTHFLLYFFPAAVQHYTDRDLVCHIAGAESDHSRDPGHYVRHAGAAGSPGYSPGSLLPPAVRRIFLGALLDLGARDMHHRSR